MASRLEARLTRLEASSDHTSRKTRPSDSCGLDILQIGRLSLSEVGMNGRISCAAINYLTNPFCNALE
jgi:hypothetical protein